MLIANNTEWRLEETSMDIIRLYGPNDMKILVYPCDLVNFLGFTTLDKFAELRALVDTYPGDQTRAIRTFVPGQYKIRVIIGYAHYGQRLSLKKLRPLLPDGAIETKKFVRITLNNMSFKIGPSGRIGFKLTSLAGIDEETIDDQIREGTLHVFRNLQLCEA